MNALPFALLALAGAVAPPLPPTPLSPALQEVETLATAHDGVQRMTVPTRINGQGPFHFTIDTGADRSVISDRLAAALALPPDGQVKIVGMTGAVPAGTVRVRSLQVGKTEQRDFAAPVLAQTDLGATGFIGLDALAGRAVLLDFRRNTMSVARSAPDDLSHDSDTIVVTGRSRYGQLILTEARVRGRRVFAVIDTGAEATVGNFALRRLVRGDKQLHLDGRIIGVTGDELPAEGDVIPRIDLGRMGLANMPVTYADVHTFDRFGLAGVPALLVGMDVLRGFERVAVDFRRRQVRFLVGSGALSRG